MRACRFSRAVLGARECADQVEPGLKFDGILFDLGVSSPQLDDAERGFSFMQDGPLDMRMSQEGPSAADVVNGARGSGTHPHFSRIRRGAACAAHRARHRRRPPVQALRAHAGTRRDDCARGARSTERHKHPATRVFQALRIHVNGELDELESGAAAAFERLAPQGRLAVISFHSLEDRMVKQFMRRMPPPIRCTRGCPTCPPMRRRSSSWWAKSVEADDDETARNPRARSARLRVAERLNEGLAA
jgi:16S rRNA (cytosine1402-N4)-methyltransferase